MKVNKTVRANLVPFWNIGIGETFFIGEDIYLKIDHKGCKPIECCECNSTIDIYDDGGFYAVNLANGEVRDMERYDKFEPCVCEVNILKAGVQNED